MFIILYLLHPYSYSCCAGLNILLISCHIVVQLLIVLYCLTIICSPILTILNKIIPSETRKKSFKKKKRETRRKKILEKPKDIYILIIYGTSDLEYLEANIEGCHTWSLKDIGISPANYVALVIILLHWNFRSLYFLFLFFFFQLNWYFSSKYYLEFCSWISFFFVCRFYSLVIQYYYGIINSRQGLRILILFRESDNINLKLCC